MSYLISIYTNESYEGQLDEFNGIKTCSISIANISGDDFVCNVYDFLKDKKRD
jgi:hypothetical protein